MPPTPTPLPIRVVVVEGAASSFWDSPLFISLLTLAGVIVGALLGFLFNWLLEARKSKREDMRKWDESVLEHSSGVITIAGELNTQLSWLSVRSDRPLRVTASEDDSGDLEINLPKEWRTYEKLVRECAKLDLIAPVKVRAATDAVRAQAQQMLLTAPGDPSSGAYDKLENALDDLGDAIRQTFGLKER
jgi:hypothetical protein